MNDTIAALATPAGRSGIGVIRLSGDAAISITKKLLADDAFEPSPRMAHLATLFDPASSEPIDEAIITVFPNPHSFTGEDVVEISCHGSPVLLRQVLDICLSLGARLAGPGEFTLRAVRSGRIDLTRAEAIRDLIDARSGAAARLAVRQLRGEMSERITPLKNDLLNVTVILESAIEFVEDDLPPAEMETVLRTLRSTADAARDSAATYKAGHLVRDGLRAVIVGRPNVGKSSLFNALLGIDRAIVTDIAGTTRDQLHENFTIGGVPVVLIDTAGLRETDDTVESIGVSRSKAAMNDADVVIVVLDASAELTPEDHEILDSVAALTHIVALNKIDRPPSTDVDRLIAARSATLGSIRPDIIPISATSGEGLADLCAAILKPFGAEEIADAGFLISDARHHDLLTRAAGEIESSIDALTVGKSEEIVLVGLQNALRYLGDITGETTNEDMLTRIFETFCIGK